MNFFTKTITLLLVSYTCGVFAAEINSNLLEDQQISPKKWEAWFEKPARSAGSQIEQTGINGSTIFMIGATQGQRSGKLIQYIKRIDLEQDRSYIFRFSLKTAKEGTIFVRYTMTDPPCTVYAEKMIRVSPKQQSYECELIPRAHRGPINHPGTLRLMLGAMPTGKLELGDMNLKKGTIKPDPVDRESVDPRFLYKNDFNDPIHLPSLCPGCEYSASEGYKGSGCLKFEYAEPKNSLVSIPLNVESAKGRAVQFSAMVRGKNIGEPTKSYLGPKLMIVYQTRDGKKKHLSTKEMVLARGNFKERRITQFMRFPSDLTTLELCVGLQGCTGVLWVDNLSAELIPLDKSVTDSVKSSTPLQKEPKFRGAMISPNRLAAVNWKDLEILHTWGANLVRYQMSPGQKILKGDKYFVWLESEMKKIDECIEKCRGLGMKVVIDLHRGPGMKRSAVNSSILSWEPEDQQDLIEAWKRLASHYKGNLTVYAYEILNEPREDDYVYDPTGKSLGWLSLVPLVAEAIRKIDPDTPIIISSTDWSSPSSFKLLKPYNIPGLIYTVHMYKPGSFTHQGVNEKKEVGIVYPGKINEEYWNKERLKKELKPVRDFQLKYNVPIFVGEFSAIRWAPGNSAEMYMMDCIEIFEEYGWDWTYHAFREWDGWSVEHSGDPNDHELKESTSRKELMIKYFKRNTTFVEKK